MNTFSAKNLVGLCRNRMVVDSPLATDLETAFSILINEGLICEPKPQVQVPTFEEIKEVLDTIESCSIDELMEATYDIATGEKTLDDYDTWKIKLRLYIDDKLYDHDSSDFSKEEFQSGDVHLGNLCLDCPTDEIERRVNDFISDSISSWNKEDDAEFNYTWCFTCDFGCDHDVRAEIDIEHTAAQLS